MLRDVALKTLRDTRRAVCWWCAGLAGMTALMVAYTVFGLWLLSAPTGA